MWSLSGLHHLVWQSLRCPSMVLQMASFHSFVWLIFHCWQWFLLSSHWAIFLFPPLLHSFLGFFLNFPILAFCCCCSVTRLCPTLCNPMYCSTPGLAVSHHLPKFAQVHVHYTLSSVPSSPSALNLSQHQGLFQLISCSHQMTKILELQLQH